MCVIAKDDFITDTVCLSLDSCFIRRESVSQFLSVVELREVKEVHHVIVRRELTVSNLERLNFAFDDKPLSFLFRDDLGRDAMLGSCLFELLALNRIDTSKGVLGLLLVHDYTRRERSLYSA